MLTALGRLAAALWLAATLATPAFAEPKAQPAPAPRDIAVATRILPPLVVEQKDTLSGFSIELWNAIAARLKLKTNYAPAPDVRALLEEVRSSKAEIGVAAISITAAREVEFEFSQPILNAGLQIMVRGGGRDGDSNPFWDLLGLLFSKTSLVWLGVALLLLLIPSHIVWFLERRHPSGIVPDTNYIPGIFYAMFWSAATLATQAENQPRQWLARIVAVFWMFTGIVFVALYTAQLAATLTVQQIQGGINGPDDLAGRKVATTRGSTAANVVRELRATVVEVAAWTRPMRRSTTARSTRWSSTRRCCSSTPPMRARAGCTWSARRSARRTTASSSAPAIRCGGRSTRPSFSCAKTAPISRSTTSGSAENNSSMLRVARLPHQRPEPCGVGLDARDEFFGRAGAERHALFGELLLQRLRCQCLGEALMQVGDVWHPCLERRARPNQTKSVLTSG